MAFARPSAPFHILYIGVALAVAMTMAACADREESATPPRPAPARTAESSQGQPMPGASTGVDPSAGPAANAASAGTASGGPSAAPAHPLASPERAAAPANDDDEGAPGADDPAETLPRRSWRARKGRPIEIILRSSPPGAVVAVDGLAIGPTPSIWKGFADASAHEFSFVLPGYAVARYRFVPTRSGFVHGQLEPIKADASGGVRTAPPRATPTAQPARRQADTR
jgi:hypothetical protein